jgi:hypothetical protein
MQPNCPPQNLQPWTDRDEEELEQAIHDAWLEWCERLRGALFEGAGDLTADTTVTQSIGTILHGAGGLAVDTTVVHPPGRGRPRALSSEDIAAAYADYLARFAK